MEALEAGLRWFPITGFDNYEINEYGDVRSIERIEEYKSRRHRERKLKPISKDGKYLVYTFSCGKKIKQRYIHRLVAQTFIGAIPKGKVVNHKDGNILNNHVSNLEIISQRDNAIHGMKRTRTGTKSSKYTGVYWCKGKFVAMARIPGGGKKYLGRHSTEEAAYEAYRKFVDPIETLQYA